LSGVKERRVTASSSTGRANNPDGRAFEVDREFTNITVVKKVVKKYKGKLPDHEGTPFRWHVQFDS
jgi:hypothetical protein